jgi:uncharacterized protein (TIGR00375 family)
MARWAQLKGLRVLGTGDFTHPGWLGELREALEPAGEGLFRLREPVEDVPTRVRSEVLFVLTAEVSSVYKVKGRLRKVHCLLLVPGFAEAAALSARLARWGDLSADGRPTLRLPARGLLETLLEVCPRGLLIPAHAWTPHFSVFGAFSGFDTLEDCFGSLSPHVPALETGLSSDPPMNWRLSALDALRLVSFSDAHSPQNLAREATEFEAPCTYEGLRRAICTGQGLVGTVEFFPEHGKYHLDGHRPCGQRLAPSESRARGYRCPSCGGRLTVGVLSRVEALADRALGARPPGAKAFRHLVPLREVLAEALGAGPATKAVQGLYMRLLEELGPELQVLLSAPLQRLRRLADGRLAEAVRRVRQGQLYIEPGYDGQYGVVRIFPPEERSQRSLF